jgi:hypothetical protein
VTPISKENDDETGEMTPKEIKMEQKNLRSIILMNATATLDFTTDYHGPIDAKVISACRRAAQSWNDLADKLERKASHDQG